MAVVATVLRKWAVDRVDGGMMAVAPAAAFVLRTGSRRLATGLNDVRARHPVVFFSSSPRWRDTASVTVSITTVARPQVLLR